MNIDNETSNFLQISQNLLLEPLQEDDNHTLKLEGLGYVSNFSGEGSSEATPPPLKKKRGRKQIRDKSEKPKKKSKKEEKLEALAMNENYSGEKITFTSHLGDIRITSSLPCNQEIDNSNELKSSTQDETMSEKKEKRVYIKKTEDKVRRWTKEEAELYEKFIDEHAEVMADSNTKRVKKIFILMSTFIGTKTPSQCRSHHQKFYHKRSRKSTYKQKGVSSNQISIGDLNVPSGGMITASKYESKRKYSFKNVDSASKKLPVPPCDNGDSLSLLSCETSTSLSVNVKNFIKEFNAKPSIIDENDVMNIRNQSSNLDFLIKEENDYAWGEDLNFIKEEESNRQNSSKFAIPEELDICYTFKNNKTAEEEFRVLQQFIYSGMHPKVFEKH